MKPDTSLPGARRLLYAASCWLNRHPMVWRFVGALFRHWPVLSSTFPFAARHQAVTRALRRPDSFLNTPHQPNLVAGDFMIAMRDDARYRADRALFQAMLPPAETVQRISRDRSRALATALAARGEFDLVDDYLMWIMLDAVLPAFGAAAAPISSGSAQGAAAIAAAQRDYMLELRHVAAQLFGGAGAPADVQMRAEACATSLRRRIRMALPLLAAGPAGGPTVDLDALERTAVGMAWVSHPVTVQSGALAVRELLRRPAVHDALRSRVRAAGADPWADAALHAEVQAHVVEFMRFHPVFPLLARDVPRATRFEAGDRRCPLRPAGGSLAVLTIAALFDKRRLRCPRRFLPGGRGELPLDDLTLMFGYGDRRCPGRDIAFEVLTSALIGLLQGPRLEWAGTLPWRRLRYDGPMIAAMPLRLRAVPT